MQQENKSNSKNEHKPTFIEAARRQQIIEATIATLASQGYVGTSFVTIAGQAGISRGLISYHFENKIELLQETYRTIYAARTAAVAQAIAIFTTDSQRLQQAIQADLAFMGSRPEYFRALVEIVFNVRSREGLTFLQDLHDPSLHSIFQILTHGQKSGEFGEFDAQSLAMIIDGAKDQFLGQKLTNPSLDTELFTTTLITMVMKSIKGERA